MVLPLRKERRISQRKQLTGLLPGPLIVEDEESSEKLMIYCKPIDVSQHGLGMITNYDLFEGQILQLDLKSRQIALKVIWVKPDFEKNDLRRCGLVLIDNREDLVKIFEDKGCLK